MSSEPVMSWPRMTSPSVRIAQAPVFLGLRAIRGPVLSASGKPQSPGESHLVLATGVAGALRVAVGGVGFPAGVGFFAGVSLAVGDGVGEGEGRSVAPPTVADAVALGDGGGLLVRQIGP